LHREPAPSAAACPTAPPRDTIAKIVDTLTTEQRSERMSRVRSKDSKAELAVRRLVFAMGYRYRLHRRDLPGSPDLVFPSRRGVIFVHGCFWHRHEGCGRMPKSRLEFWEPKLEANRMRDEDNLRALDDMGWRALVIWECELKDLDRVRNSIRTFLGT
jgi:DNA mismatch endonuclease, patch repair protein